MSVYTNHIKKINYYMKNYFIKYLYYHLIQMLFVSINVDYNLKCYWMMIMLLVFYNLVVYKVSKKYKQYKKLKHIIQKCTMI